MTIAKWKPRPGTVQWWKDRTKRDPDTGCLLYTGFVMPTGHAQISFQGKKVLIHRLAYETVHGPIAPGLVVCHTCDRGHCVSGRHLFAGTQKDNLRDMFAKGRARPRGKATAALASFPTVSGRVNQTLSRSGPRENFNTMTQVVDRVHHMRPIDSLGEAGAFLLGLAPASVAPESKQSHGSSQQSSAGDRPRYGTEIARSASSETRSRATLAQCEFGSSSASQSARGG